MALWEAIHATLAEEIAAGHYPTGARLPGEVALARRFGVNRHTVRRALATLVADGRIHVQRGAGATVLPPPIDYPLSDRTRFSEAVQQAGRAPTRRLLRLETLAATDTDAEQLRIAPGDPVCILEVIGMADGVPVTAAAHRFPVTLLPGIQAALAGQIPAADDACGIGAADGRGEAGISAALAECGVPDYRRGETRITAVLADPTLAHRLMIAEGAPLIMSAAIDLDGGDRPVNAGHAWMVAERLTLVVGDRRVTSRLRTERKESAS
ncbi:MAG: phosphonate metabolism transcriptional regulator PhnF [Pseudomonadota bacterium]